MGSVGHRHDTLKARRVLGGIAVDELARKANLTDEIVYRLENGDNCRPEVTQRVLDALAPSVTVATSSVANPSVITVTTHSFQTGDSVTIAGHTASTPSINATHVVTRVNGTTFTIPVNVTGGGTGGTATLDPVSIGLARL